MGPCEVTATDSPTFLVFFFSARGHWHREDISVLFESGCSGSLARDRNSPWCGRDTSPLRRDVGGAVLICFFYSVSLIPEPRHSVYPGSEGAWWMFDYRRTWLTRTWLFGGGVHCWVDQLGFAVSRSEAGCLMIVLLVRSHRELISLNVVIVYVSAIWSRAYRTPRAAHCPLTLSRVRQTYRHARFLPLFLTRTW